MVAVVDVVVEVVVEVVASLADAWIETREKFENARGYMSRPSRTRGLKPQV